MAAAMANPAFASVTLLYSSDMTVGIHSRIEGLVRRIIAALDNGNVYVNRSMIGAVVSTQPFGGSGLSGTGPKGQRAKLRAAFRHRAGRQHQYCGGWWQRGIAHRGGVRAINRTIA
jgi:delta 1-pyrroline-5-carboxylate dehydrogenase